MSNADVITDFVNALTIAKHSGNVNGAIIQSPNGVTTAPDYRKARGILTLAGRAPYSEPYSPLSAPIPDSYEEKISLGIALAELETSARWKLGDLALTVMASEDVITDLNLTQFAHQIGIVPRTLQNRVKLSRYWPEHLRDTWPNCSYSHYKSAAIAFPSDLDGACRALDHCSELGLTVSVFEMWLKENKASKEGALKERVLLLEDTLAMAYRTLLMVTKGWDDPNYQTELEQVASVLGLREKGQ